MLSGKDEGAVGSRRAAHATRTKRISSRRQLLPERAKWATHRAGPAAAAAQVATKSFVNCRLRSPSGVESARSA